MPAVQSGYKLFYVKCDGARYCPATAYITSGMQLPEGWTIERGQPDKYFCPSHSRKESNAEYSQ